MQKVFAPLFILTLLAFIYFTNFNLIVENSQTMLEDVRRKEPYRLLTSYENVMSGSSFARGPLREAYAGLQLLKGKKEVRNFKVIKDQYGSLHGGDFDQTLDSRVPQYAKRIRRLKDAAGDAPVMFVAAPGKYSINATPVPSGYPLDLAATLDLDGLMLYLFMNGVDTFDLRYSDWRQQNDQLFYKTSDCWTIRTALEAAGLIAQEINTRYDFALDTSRLDMTQYDITAYPRAMIGSLGRSAGSIYSGAEDFELAEPQFETDFRRITEGNGEGEYVGDFSESLLEKDRFRSGEFLIDDLYTIYLGGGKRLHRIENKSLEGKKVLIIGDQYFTPTAVFLSTVFSEVTFVSPIEGIQTVDIEKLIEENEYDCILIGCQPANVKSAMFPFYRNRERWSLTG